MNAANEGRELKYTSHSHYKGPLYSDGSTQFDWLCSLPCKLFILRAAAGSWGNGVCRALTEPLDPGLPPF